MTAKKYIEKILNNKMFYNKLITVYSKYSTPSKSGQDILHDILTEMLENNSSWDAARRKVLYNIEKKDCKKDNDTLVKMAHEEPNFYRRLYPSFNLKACEFFDQLNEALTSLKLHTGRHGTSDGEKKIGKYWVDFYIPEYKVVIEYNEKHHYWSKQKINYDLRRRYFIESFIKKPIIIIYEGKEDIKWTINEIRRSVEYEELKNFYK